MNINMKQIWSGDILLDAEQTLRSIRLLSQDNGHNVVLPKTPLQFLSIVETARIPLHMTVGRSLCVQTDDVKALSWFSSILLGAQGDLNNSDDVSWWESARSQSPLGILVSTSDGLFESSSMLGPRVTELLFFASRHDPFESGRPPTPPESSPLGPGHQHDAPPQVRVLALPLSSELLARDVEGPTPPASPTNEVPAQESRFLPSTWDQPVHEPPVKKLKTAAFDVAEERKRKARRSGGQGVAAAAAVANRSDDATPMLKHRRSTSSAQVHIQTRPSSRASSVASARPASRREPSAPAVSRPSTLSQSQSAPAVPQTSGEAALEHKNKEFISRMLLNAVRVRGLNQSMSIKPRASPSAASSAVGTAPDVQDGEQMSEEEYKVVFHQVYRGTCVMFRKHISSVDLQQAHIGAVIEAISQLLGLFLQDPLANEEADVQEDFTPGGRKPFGSAAVRNAGDHNPFLQAAVLEQGSKANTPCLRKEKVTDMFATPPTFLF